MANMRIDDEVHSKLKYLAGQTGASMSAYIDGLLEGKEVKHQGGDSSIHEKLDILIAAVEGINKDSPRVSPAEPPKQQWQKVEPTTAQLREMGTPTYSRLDEIEKEISGIEDELEHCQDIDTGKRLFDKMNSLYTEKDEILLRRNEK